MKRVLVLLLSLVLSLSQPQLVWASSNKGGDVVYPERNQFYRPGLTTDEFVLPQNTMFTIEPQYNPFIIEVNHVTNQMRITTKTSGDVMISVINPPINDPNFDPVKNPIKTKDKPHFQKHMEAGVMEEMPLLPLGVPHGLTLTDNLNGLYYHMVINNMYDHGPYFYVGGVNIFTLASRQSKEATKDIEEESSPSSRPVVPWIAAIIVTVFILKQRVSAHRG